MKSYEELMAFIDASNKKAIRPDGRPGRVVARVTSNPKDVADLIDLLLSENKIVAGVTGASREHAMVLSEVGESVELRAAPYEQRFFWIAADANGGVIGALDLAPDVETASVETASEACEPCSKRFTLKELCALAGMPAKARLVEVSYHSEPDGNLDLYSHDGDLDAALYITWDTGRSSAEPGDDFLVAVGKLMTEHGIARISGGHIAVSKTGVVTSAGVRSRVWGRGDDDGDEDEG